MKKSLTTRERLLEAAISVIEAQGEGAIRVDHVAELAGFTKPVLYTYFKNRDELIVAAQSERYTRALELGRSEVEDAVRKCSSADDFFLIMNKWVQSFADRDGERRRRFRVEVLGSSVSRVTLREKLREANRRQAEDLGALLRIAKDRQWLTLDVEPEDLAMWWTGLVLSRYLIEMDAEYYDDAAWDATSRDVMRAMIRRDDSSTE